MYRLLFTILFVSFSFGNEISNIIPKEEIHNYPVIHYVETKMSKSNFEDLGVKTYYLVYEVLIRIVDKIIILSGILTPLLFLIWLLPIAFINIVGFSNETIKNKLLAITTLFIVITIIAFLIYMISFYVTELSYSFSTILILILQICLSILLAIVFVPLALFSLSFLIDTKNLVLFEQGTMKNVIVELVNYHLYSLGINVQLDMAMFFLLLKTIIFIFILKNINLIGSFLFGNKTKLTVILAISFVCIVYYFNAELYKDLFNLVYQLSKFITGGI